MSEKEERTARVVKITQLLNSMLDDGAIDGFDIALFAEGVVHYLPKPYREKLATGDYAVLTGIKPMPLVNLESINHLREAIHHLRMGEQLDGMAQLNIAQAKMRNAQLAPGPALPGLPTLKPPGGPVLPPAPILGGGPPQLPGLPVLDKDG